MTYRLAYFAVFALIVLIFSSPLILEAQTPRPVTKGFSTSPAPAIPPSKTIPSVRPPAKPQIKLRQPAMMKLPSSRETSLQKQQTSPIQIVPAQPAEKGEK